VSPNTILANGEILVDYEGPQRADFLVHAIGDIESDVMSISLVYQDSLNGCQTTVGTYDHRKSQHITLADQSPFLGRIVTLKCTT
jgi:hypothetical protein